MVLVAETLACREKSLLLILDNRNSFSRTTGKKPIGGSTMKKCHPAWFTNQTEPIISLLTGILETAMVIDKIRIIFAQSGAIVT
jgi:hypothetical protein